MIRLRTSKGKVFPLKEEVKFVEICDTQGNLALLIQQPGKDSVRIIYPSDPGFISYLQAWGLKPTKIVTR